MLKVMKEGPVTIFRMGRSIGKTVLYNVHAFIIEDMLVDSGTGWAREEFIQALEGQPLSTLVNTHHHEDHTGNNKLIQDKFGVNILIHENGLSYIKKPEELGLHLYQRFIWDSPKPSTGDPIGNTIILNNYTFRVLHTHGHSPDHICLFEEKEGWLFTGDLYCGKGFKYLRTDENFNTIIVSLKQLAVLDFDTIFCSLLGVVKNGKNSLLWKIQVMEELKGKAIMMHGKGYPVKKIRQSLLGREGLMRYITSGHYSKQNTIDSILL